MTDWVILRCSGSRTLALAASLTEAGFECWSPVETVTEKRCREVGGEKVVVSTRKVQRPMTPRFVFARANRMQDLIELTHSPALTYRVWDKELGRHVAKGHPYFSLLPDGDGYALIEDWELDALRLGERKRKPRAKARQYKPGEEVRLVEGGFTGLTGVVQRMKGRLAEILCKGWKHSADLPTEAMVPLDGLEKAA